jgi:subtilisin family serine protease
VVAVLDSGIDTTHPDLIGNLWTNPREVPGNRIDDDQNGYVDDVNGCTVWGLGDLVDSLGHGTHVSGIIAATASNNRGVAGVSPSARVMPVKVMDQDGVVSSFAMATGLRYAASMNVRIACLSFGGPGPWSESDKASTSIAVNAGMLLVSAAGNEWANNDITPFYPASSPSPVVIAVGASGHHDQRAVFSNYGARSVDLFAPGVAIPSTAPNGRYLVESGTSAAAPHVAAVCALVASANPSLSSAAIRNAVLAGADRLPTLKGRSVTGGRLNAEKALKMAGGPLLEMAGHTMLDGKRLGASGNGDGLLNPGEDFTLAISIRNTGGQSATQASTQVTISSGSGDVSVVKGSRPWGTLAVGTSVNNNAAPFVPGHRFFIVARFSG